MSRVRIKIHRVEYILHHGRLFTLKYVIGQYPWQRHVNGELGRGVVKVGVARVSYLYALSHGEL